MTTERDVPTFLLRVQVAPRGDLRWVLLEELEPFQPAQPYETGGWVKPDDLWSAVRADLAVAIQTWLHRLRRSDDADDGIPRPSE